jgi:ADP-ribose pyrophosphatase
MRDKITTTEEIYDGRIVKLDVHSVKLPDGNTTTREVVRHPGAVAIVALDEAQHVLLVRQYRIAADRIMLEIPAGTLEPDESPTLCAVRELQEEAGYLANTLTPIGGFFVAPGYTTEYIHLFVGTDLVESTLPTDADEFIEVERVPLTTALDFIERGEISDSKSIAGLLRVARRYGL